MGLARGSCGRGQGGSTIAYWFPAAAVAALIAWLSHQPSLPDLDIGIPFIDLVAHFLMYGLFTLTLVIGATRGFSTARRTPTRVVLAVVVASLYGISDEWHQSFVPGRDVSAWDWAADTVGALVMAAIVLFAFRRMAAATSRV